MGKKALSLLVFLLSVAPLWAQPLTLTSQKGPKQAFFAAPITVQYTFSHEPGYSVELDQKTLPPAFGLQKIDVQTPASNQTVYHLTLLPLDLGDQPFPALTFMEKNARQQPAGSVQTQPFAVKVEPVELFKNRELIEIREPQAPFNWLAWLLAALLLGAAVYFLIRWYQRRRARALLLGPAADNRPCDVIALSKINALVDSNLWQQRQYKLFYTTLGEIFGEYLQRRFGLDVSADTSAELLRDLKKLPQLEPMLPLLRRYVSSSDLVKFARAVPPQEAMHADVQTLQKSVTLTALKPEDDK